MTDLGDALTILEEAPFHGFRLSVEYPLGFELGAIHIMWDQRFCIALFTHDEKGNRVWGTGYDRDPQEATRRAVERCLFFLNDKMRADGFVQKDWTPDFKKNIVAPTKPKREIEPPAGVDLSKLELKL